MHLFSEQSHWSIRVDFHENVDFCVWILEKNGLSASPFNHSNQNAERKDVKQMLSFAPDDWYTWINNVLISPQEVPPSLWRGNPSIGAILAQQWKTYETLASQRHRWESLIVPQTMRNIPELYSLLEPYQRHFDSLDIVLVNYKYMCHLVAPPSFVLISVANGNIDSETFKKHIISGAEELVKAFSKGSKSMKDSSEFAFPWESVLDAVPIEFRGHFQPYLEQLKRGSLIVQKRFFQLFYAFNEIREKGGGKGYIKNVMPSGKDKIITIALGGIELNISESNISRSPSQEPLIGGEVSISVQGFDQNGMHILYALL